MPKQWSSKYVVYLNQKHQFEELIKRGVDLKLDTANERKILGIFNDESQAIMFMETFKFTHPIFGELPIKKWTYMEEVFSDEVEI